jgi:hypothetical protein
VSSETVSPQTVSPETASPETVSPEQAESGSDGLPGGRPPAASGHRRSWWLWPIAVLITVAALVVGGTVVHVFDQRQAAADLYRTQVLTTISRFLGAERQLVAVPAAQRDASVLDWLADSISADPGVNGSGTLTVSVGAGSAAQPEQIIFTVTVASPHGTSAFAVWYLTPQGPSSSDAGACVLWSTLKGSGRATADLNLGGSYFEPPCPSQWWSSNSAGDPAQPHFAVAGISQSAP